MTIEYNPRTFLLLVPKTQLHEYFVEKCGCCADLDWDALRENECETVFHAWQALPLPQKDAIGIEFQNVAALTTDKGVQTIIEEGRFHGLDLVPELTPLGSHTEKVFHTLLHRPRVFWVASQFVHADNLKRYWHRHHDLPRTPPNLSSDARSALKRAMVQYFVEKQGRGEFCQIDVYRRYENVHYFMVYLSDYPNTFIGYHDDGRLERHPQRPAFDIVFRYDENLGHLDLYAEGAQRLRLDLEQVFGKIILCEDLSQYPRASAAFELDPLKDPEFTFQTDPSDRIASVQVRSLRVSVPDKSGARITFDAPRYSESGDIHDLMSKAYNTTHWHVEDLRVDHATMKVSFFVDGKRRPKAITFNLSPASCNLKDELPEHQTIKRCLRRWKIERE